MLGRILFAVVLALLLTPYSAQAESAYINIEQRLTAEQRRSTGLDTLSSEQLALLNRLLRGEAQATGSPDRSENTTPTAGKSFIGLDDKPIKSRLKVSVRGWEPGTVFELENGQQWKVLKGKVSLRDIPQGQEINVVPGFAGRWFLHVDEDLPGARVYRIN